MNININVYVYIHFTCTQKHFTQHPCICILLDLPQYSAATIKKDLQYLVNEFEIEKFGNNRGTVYKIRAK